MRLILPIILTLCFSLAALGQELTPPLTNSDVIELHKAGLSAEVIAAKIKSSPTDFDTSVASLQELKKVGITDVIILAMLEARKEGKRMSPATPAPATGASEAKTNVELRFPPRGAYKHKKNIEVEYDRFKDVTYVRLKYLNVTTGLTDHVSIVATYSYKGTNPATPETVNLGFYSRSRSWRFLKDRAFVVIADGERLDFGEAVRLDSDVSSSRYSVSVSETLAVSMPLESFLKIVNASSLQLRLGYYELPLAPDHYEALKDFASRMQ